MTIQESKKVQASWDLLAETAKELRPPQTHPCPTDSSHLASPKGSRGKVSTGGVDVETDQEDDIQ